MAKLRIIDFETTGMEPPFEVVEAGWCDLDTSTFTPQQWHSNLYGVDAIPPEVRAIHHIQPAMVQGMPKFDPDQFVHDAMLAGVDGLVAFNSEFEAKWVGQAVAGRLQLVCAYKAALRTWPAAPSHGNMALVYYLQDQGLVEPDLAMMAPAHRAGPDAYATSLITAALYQAGVTGGHMVRWTREYRHLPRCPIGEHRGKEWADVPHGFLSWMTREVKEDDLRWLAQNEIDRRQSL